MAAGASAICARSGHFFWATTDSPYFPARHSIAAPVRPGTRRPKIRRRRLTFRHATGYPDVIRITYVELVSGFCPFSTGWLREARPEQLRALYLQPERPIVSGNAKSEGMLASYSNSKAEIRRTWMGPPPDLPLSPKTKLILISLHCTRYDGICCSAVGNARVKRAYHARTSGLNRRGKVGLPNDDGVANANTPSSTSQSYRSDNRNLR
jgi:hypothetical protein